MGRSCPFFRHFHKSVPTFLWHPVHIQTWLIVSRLHYQVFPCPVWIGMSCPLVIHLHKSVQLFFRHPVHIQTWLISKHRLHCQVFPISFMDRKVPVQLWDIFTKVFNFLRTLCTYSDMTYSLQASLSSFPMSNMDRKVLSISDTSSQTCSTFFFDTQYIFRHNYSLQATLSSFP